MQKQSTVSACIHFMSIFQVNQALTKRKHVQILTQEVLRRKLDCCMGSHFYKRVENDIQIHKKHFFRWQFENEKKKVYSIVLSV